MTDIGLLIGFVALLGIAVGFIMMEGNRNRQRIREHIEKGGGRVLDIIWNPTEGFYDVRYQTQQGKVYEATCKTTVFSGVYWTGNAPPSGLPGNDSGDEA